MSIKQNKTIRRAYIVLQRKICRTLTHISPIAATKYVYKYNTGKRLNLKNPQTFNEKLQWLKLFGNQDIMLQCADKYRVREYVAGKGCPEILNTLYGVFDRVDEIDFDTLPDAFVLKTTDGCGTNIICRNKAALDWQAAKEKLQYWMTHKYGWETAETHYLSILPRIICEKIIDTADGTLPNDFKFFCFNGEPRFFYYGYDRENEFKKLHCDLDWNVLDITKEKSTLAPTDDMRPASFDKMLHYAKRLSEGIPFVRVDFYDSNGAVVFGEMTFTPTAGMSEIYTEEAAKWLGNMICLPIEGENHV